MTELYYISIGDTIDRQVVKIVLTVKFSLFITIRQHFTCRGQVGLGVSALFDFGYQPIWLFKFWRSDALCYIPLVIQSAYESSKLY